MPAGLIPYVDNGWHGSYNPFEAIEDPEWEDPRLDLKERMIEVAKAKLPDDMYAIFALRMVGMSQRQIGEHFGINQSSTAHRLRSLQKWIRWHLNAPPLPDEAAIRETFKSRFNPLKLNIFIRWLDGEPLSAVAREYGVEHSTANLWSKKFRRFARERDNEVARAVSARIDYIKSARTRARKHVFWRSKDGTFNSPPIPEE